METVDQLAGRWVDDFPSGRGGPRSEATRIHNRERISLLAEDFKGVPLDGLSRVAAHAWAVGHPQRVKAARSMFSDAVRVGLLSDNPFSDLGVSAGRGRSGITLLEEAEIDALCRAAEARWGLYGASCVSPMVRVAAYTGMRPGELYALRWSKVDLDGEVVRVRSAVSPRTGLEGLPKKERVRDIELLPQAQAVLARIERRGPYVFPKQRSQDPLRQRSHHHYWSPARSDFWDGLDPDRQREVDPGFDFYELRHWYGTYLADVLEMQPHEIAEQMGHGDGGGLALRIYIHARNKTVRAKIRDRKRAVRAA